MTSETALAPAVVSTYVYEPLEPDSIRLLSILPMLSGEGQIRCQTACFQRTARTGYIALSYAWGPEAEPCHIILDGQRFNVRKNLFDFLHAARKFRGRFSGWLWIDALSIDQSNDIERTHQVASMSKIYSNATYVLIWLGLRSRDSDVAMHILCTSVEHWLDPLKFYHMWTPGHSAAITQLLERPYWSRLWSTCAVIMCDGSCVACTLFVDFVDILAQKWTDVSPVIVEIIGNRTILRSPSPEAMESIRTVRKCPAISVVKYASQAIRVMPLLDLMCALKHLGCAESRDKVYALLGVAAQTHATIEPDYTLPVVTLAHAVLRHHHQLKPPKDTHEVYAQCQELERLLGLCQSQMLFLIKNDDWFSVKSYICSPVFDSKAQHGINFGWVVFHGHDSVEDMLTRITPACNPPKKLKAALETAVRYGDEATVDILLALKVIKTDVHLLTRVRYHGISSQKSLFDTAVRCGHVGVARRMLETGLLDVNAHLPRLLHHGRGVCPLHLAAHQCDVLMVRTLLSIEGIDVDHLCKGVTPLESAVRPANLLYKRGATLITRMLLASKKVHVPRKVSELCNDWGLLEMPTWPSMDEIAECVRTDGTLGYKDWDWWHDEYGLRAERYHQRRSA
ncbi:hypothetical protein LTR22_012534 [Elasticomyces elasticus]|nr:hypothetical protein LTR22_012534 [Elasticomyces elasticus]